MKINHTIPLRIDFELGRTKQPVGSLLDSKKRDCFPVRRFYSQCGQNYYFRQMHRLRRDFDKRRQDVCQNNEIRRGKFFMRARE